MNKILKARDFLDNLAEKYDIKIILDFLVDNGISSDKFSYIGKCDDNCDACGTSDFSIWREEELYYDEDNNRFIIVSGDINENETLKTVDFAIYICNECGKWSAYIE